MNSNIDTEKIIDKIKKLLELTTSNNEAEAKLAMERAQKLMMQYNINSGDLAKENPSEIIIKENYWNDIFNRSGVFEAIPKIIPTITEIFGVYSLYNASRNHTIKGVNLVGFKTNIVIAKFALDSILQQGLIEYRTEFKKFRSAMFGLEFWSGFAIGLERKFKSYSNETGLVIYDPVKLHMRSLAKGFFNAKCYDGNAIQSGINAGLKAEIRKGIQQNNTGKLLN